MELNKRPCRLHELLEEVMQLLRPLQEERGLRIERVGEPLPELALDADKMSQVLANLLNNAIKFAPPKTQISVTLRRLNVGLTPVQEIQVIDQGLEIDPQRQPHLFSKYAQVQDKEQVILPKGTGLGLAVSRLIVNAHDGQIGYRYQAGMGNVFFIRLPESGVRS
jgi:signal transduction histidine kinase